MGHLRRFSILSMAISLVCLSSFLNAQARVEDKDEVHNRLKNLHGTLFPLSRIATCDKAGSLYRSADLDISTNRAQLFIEGRDLTDRSWSATLSVTGLGCEIFQNDLDGNGLPDLVIYTPGIDDRGSYGTTLTILLFDKQGKPFPWQATGRFTLVDAGIQEMVRTTNGLEIIQTMEVGLPAWDGISFLSLMYRLENGRVASVPGAYAGIQFPHIVKANQTDARIERTAGKVDLSTTAIAFSMSSPVQDTDAQFVRYEKNTSSQKSSSSTAVAAQQIVNPGIDMSAQSKSEPYVIASDGSQIDTPSILVVDKSDGSRRIFFHPEDGDFNQLNAAKYRIHQTGSDCTGLDDCHPFIVWAK
jgi:hypothetical protein